jgi:hypothetical protein
MTGAGLLVKGPEAQGVGSIFGVPMRARDGTNNAIRLWGLAAGTRKAHRNRGSRAQGRRQRRVKRL